MADPGEHAAGQILDGLGVQLTLDDGDLVASAVVAAKVVKANGDVALILSRSDGMSWLEELGIVTAAAAVVNQQSFLSRRDKDDE